MEKVFPDGSEEDKEEIKVSEVDNPLFSLASEYKASPHDMSTSFLNELCVFMNICYFYQLML